MGVGALLDSGTLLMRGKNRVFLCAKPLADLVCRAEVAPRRTLSTVAAGVCVAERRNGDGVHSAGSWQLTDVGARLLESRQEANSKAAEKVRSLHRCAACS